MKHLMNRRDFLQVTAAGSVMCLNVPLLFAFNTPDNHKLISPGCRKSKVKVARLYIGSSHGLWPKPELNFEEEARFYESEFARLKDELADVEFPVDEIVTSPDQVKNIKDRLLEVDGILLIHLNIGIEKILSEILNVGKPTTVFAVPYSGHEWVRFGALQRQPQGANMQCMLTSDYSQLAVAIRPFRAIHHLREAKILNLTTRPFDVYARDIRTKFGTEIKQIQRQRVVTAYHRIRDEDARAEAQQWIGAADAVIEPSEAEIFKSCKLALAMEAVLDEEEATVMTIDCYGTMWDKTIQLPAYPCLGFVRLNNLGLGGICESDLRSAMMHILFQGLVGKPGFISDPTVDESDNSIILAHCLGTTRMDGPDKPAASYKLRTVMERKEGVVPQVQMRIGERVTQAQLVGIDELRYFTGEIIDTPVSISDDRGCRTKITVRVDGSVSNLWRNWQSGLHRQTCYGDITKELAALCRYKDIKLINEAA